MFLGHYGVAFAAKRAAPENSLGVLVLAAQWLDAIWPIFLLLGWERVGIVPGITRMVPMDFESYPWSHSLLMTAVWNGGSACPTCHENDIPNGFDVNVAAFVTFNVTLMLSGLLFAESATIETVPV